MKPATKAYLRSIPGQLMLLAATFLGAVALAVLAIVLRDDLFEPYIREKYPPIDAEIREFLDGAVEGNAELELLEQLIDREAERLAQAQGAVPEAQRDDLIEKHRKKAARQVLSACYGEWMTRPRSDKSRRILAAMFENHEAEVLELFQRTLVVGNLEQKLLALDGVNWLNQENSHEAHRLLDYARQHALRRGDTPILVKCDQILSNVKRE